MEKQWIDDIELVYEAKTLKICVHLSKKYIKYVEKQKRKGGFRNDIAEIYLQLSLLKNYRKMASLITRLLKF